MYLGVWGGRERGMEREREIKEEGKEDNTNIKYWFIGKKNILKVHHIIC
jgi:hypothetical protein